MRRNGNEVGIDASFTVDPDDNGSDNLLERDGYRVSGASGYVGIVLEIPPDNAEGLPPGNYGFTYDSWYSEDNEETFGKDEAHFMALADVIEAIQDSPNEWRRYLRQHRIED